MIPRHLIFPGLHCVRCVCVLCVADTERLVGDAAKNQVDENPENTVFDAKRLIGRKITEAVVQADMKYWPFKARWGYCLPRDREYASKVLCLLFLALSSPDLCP